MSRLAFQRKSYSVSTSKPNVFFIVSFFALCAEMAVGDGFPACDPTDFRLRVHRHSVPGLRE